MSDHLANLYKLLLPVLGCSKRRSWMAGSTAAMTVAVCKRRDVWQEARGVMGGRKAVMRWEG